MHGTRAGMAADQLGENEMSEAATPPPREPVIRVTAMPADTNPYGDIFGGWLMSQMDLAAGSAAARHAAGRAVTIAVEGMAFHGPVSVGDEVSVYAEIVAVGRTSMRIEVEAWRRPRDSLDASKVTQAAFTFVALGPDRRPVPVPPIRAS
jgi:acyl-CoA thioesterase YciA